jgi:siroheme decarboxylase
VIRHRRLGYAANAMAVWDVPDERVAGVAPLLASDPAVTLCYRRARALPQWPYNLYCMVHGRERSRVAGELARMNASYGLQRFPKAVLFSEHCFSQRAASYG